MCELHNILFNIYIRLFYFPKIIINNYIVYIVV